jgi:hypothetical protein
VLRPSRNFAIIALFEHNNELSNRLSQVLVDHYEQECYRMWCHAAKIPEPFVRSPKTQT